eukprot:gene20358-27122_t
MRMRYPGCHVVHYYCPHPGPHVVEPSSAGFHFIPPIARWHGTFELREIGDWREIWIRHCLMAPKPEEITSLSSGLATVKTTNKACVRAVASGVFGSTGALCGKLAGGFLDAHVPRLGLFALMLASNAFGVNLLVCSLQDLPSLQATTLATAANIASTGLMGRLVFLEQLGSRWVVGTLCLLLGVLLVNHAASSTRLAPLTAEGGQATVREKADSATCDMATERSDASDVNFHSDTSHQADSADSEQSAAPSTQSACNYGIHSYRLIISYDGTKYSGWQLQPHDPTIQVVQFYSDQILGPKFAYTLNCLLPRDIRVKHIYRTAQDFSVTCSALSKVYHYYIDNNEHHDPFTLPFRLHIYKPLNLEDMRAAAALMQGTHDFSLLSNRGEDNRRRNPMKTLTRVAIVEEGQGLLRIEIDGSGFLYKMVRNLTGALLAVGHGLMSVEEVASMLEGSGGDDQGERNLSYTVAPGKGLFLEEVRYPPETDNPDQLLYPDLSHNIYGRLTEHIPGTKYHFED